MDLRLCHEVLFPAVICRLEKYEINRDDCAKLTKEIINSIPLNFFNDIDLVIKYCDRSITSIEELYSSKESNPPSVGYGQTKAEA